MKAILQRVSSASVSVDGKTIGEIQHGFLVLLGAGQDDTDTDLEYIFDKIIKIRVFSDENGKMNRSIQDTGGALLIISQFTLMAQTKKGRRPSFVKAMEPTKAKQMYKTLIQKTKDAGIRTEEGEFGANMAVSLVNDGPVTIILDSKDPNS